MSKNETRTEHVIDEQAEMRKIAVGNPFGDIEAIKTGLMFNVLCQMSITLALIYDEMKGR